MNRHPLDLFSLFSGLLLTGIALAALFGVSTTVAGWVWPTVLVVVGAVVVAAALGGGREDVVGEAAAGASTDPDLAEALVAARDEVEDADHTTP